MSRKGRRKIPLGGWVLFAAFLLVLCILQLATNSYLLTQGVRTQALVLSAGTESCAQTTSAGVAALQGHFPVYTVQFTDQSGQQRTGTISSCDYGGFNTTTGDSITIVYDPGDLSTIEPLSVLEASKNSPAWTIVTLLIGLVTLVLLYFWIRKRRMRKASLRYQNPG